MNWFIKKYATTRIGSVLIAGIVFFGLTIPTSAQFIVYNDGMATVHIEAACVVTSEGSFTSQTNGVDGQIDNDGTFEVTKNWTNNNASSNAFSTSSGLVELLADGVTGATIGGTRTTTFYNLTTSKTSGITLAVDTEVDNIFDFNSATSCKVALGAYNFTIGNTGTSAITGYNKDEAFSSGTTGYLRQEGIGSGNRTGAIYFPVICPDPEEVTAQYALCYVDNSAGTADRFDVRVCDKVYIEGSLCSGSQITADVTDLTWEINEQTAGGTTADIFLQYVAGTEEMAGFNNALCRVMRHDGSSWTATQALGAVTDEGGGYSSRLTTGITSFSPFSIEDDDGLLPIELLRFEAKLSGEYVDLFWSTASEINNDYFTIEKTNDLNYYQTVAKVGAVGNSSEVNNYNSFDSDPYEGISYYRLKQTDYDGTFTYSDLAAIRYNIAEGTVSIYPNPSDGGQINILVENEQLHEEVLVVLYNALGEEVYSKGFIKESNQVMTMINPEPALPPGIYHIVGSSKYELFRKKILVQ